MRNEVLVRSDKNRRLSRLVGGGVVEGDCGWVEVPSWRRGYVNVDVDVGG